MNLDLQIEGRYSQRTEDLQHLKQNHGEFEIPTDLPSGQAVTVLRTLASVLGISLSLAAVILMAPDIAFISVTLILSACGAIAIGSDKIIALFSRRHP